MPRSRVPSIYPSIQLFLRAGTASLEVAILAMLAVLSSRKVNYGIAYAAAAYALLLNIFEILGLTSQTRKIPRLGPVGILTELLAVGLYAGSFVTIGFDGYQGGSEVFYEARRPWRDYVLILGITVMPMHFVFFILTCVDCCCLRRRRERANGANGQEMQMDRT